MRRPCFGISVYRLLLSTVEPGRGGREEKAAPLRAIALLVDEPDRMLRSIKAFIPSRPISPSKRDAEDPSAPEGRSRAWRRGLRVARRDEAVALARHPVFAPDRGECRAREEGVQVGDRPIPPSDGPVVRFWDQWRRLQDTLSLQPLFPQHTDAGMRFVGPMQVASRFRAILFRW